MQLGLKRKKTCNEMYWIDLYLFGKALSSQHVLIFLPSCDENEIEKNFSSFRGRYAIRSSQSVSTPDTRLIRYYEKKTIFERGIKSQKMTIKRSLNIVSDWIFAVYYCDSHIRIYKQQAIGDDFSRILSEFFFFNIGFNGSK